MATNLTTNATTTFTGINAGKVFFVKVTGNWGGSTSVAVQTSNGNTTAEAWETYPVNGTLTSNSAYYYQNGDADNVKLATSSVTPNTTSLWAQVVEVKSL